MNPIFSTPLFRSIIATVLVCGFSEAALFLVIANIFTFGLNFVSAFLLTQVVFHAVLTVFLFSTRKFFYILNGMRPLQKINIANKVTLLRISMLPSLLFLILAAKTYPVGPILISALAITFFTDAIDGRLSRSRDEVTMIGKILDSVSDYSLLIVVSIAYYIYELIPKYLFAIILARLLFQAFGMLILLIARRDWEPKPTLFGKAAVATTMVLFASEALKIVLSEDYFKYFQIIEIISAVIVSLSIIDKAYYFITFALKPKKTP